ncbi:Ni/Fe-hydrogenase cytochrome b subunit, partial [Salmonella enterica subsp. enterica serovar Eastbourne]|nr:Ni/Fe-hydrogenase cytochrome b subunit [Salmonella enterica subsp. enterica serovar Eastbourne]
KLALTVSVLMALFLVLRFGELIYRGKLGLAFAGDYYSVLFWCEIVLMAIALAVFSIPAFRRDSRLLYIGALSMMLGCAAWRLAYSLLAFDPGNGYHYFPATEELLISIGFVAVEICAYLFLIRLLPILPAVNKTAAHPYHEASKS